MVFTTEKKREWQKRYVRRPEIQAKRRAYATNPKAREKKRLLDNSEKAQEKRWTIRQTPDYKAWKRDYDRLYRQRPTTKARRRVRYHTTGEREKHLNRMKQRNQKPETKTKRHDYESRPEVRARIRSWKHGYNQRPQQQSQMHDYYQRPEIKARRRNSARARYAQPLQRERILRQQKVQRRSRGVSSRRQTHPEQQLERLLAENFPGDWRYTGQGDVTIAQMAPDFFQVNGKKGIIEVFGCYHHACSVCGHPSKYARPAHDAKRLKMFEDMGLKTLVVWEHELKDPPAVVTRVREAFYG